jgi:hypothetical protein
MYVCMYARKLSLSESGDAQNTLPGSRNLILDFRDHLMVEHVDLDSLSAA